MSANRVEQAGELAASNISEDWLKERKEKTLVESNAQTIFQDLTNLRALAEGPNRWVWELLQNACDAVDKTKGVNRVRIEVGAGKLKFMHDGADFTGDEMTHLIYHGSTKQGEEGKRGKFGTGFLTVHLISAKVRVSGVLNKDGMRESFAFVLDRGGVSFKVIQDKMEEAWRELLGSRRPLIESVDYSTVYEFELDEKAEAVVRRGLENLEAGLPYVLSFIDEIKEVTVVNGPGAVIWGRLDRKSAEAMVTTDVGRMVPGQEPTMFRVSCVGDPEKGVAVAGLFGKDGETWRCARRETSPKLFYPLPLVGTHELGVPFAIASAKFEPERDRDGIYAGAMDDDLTQMNWRLLAQVPWLFGKLVEGCVKEGWAGLEELARFSGSFSGDWLDRARFGKDVLRPCIEYLCGEEGPEIMRNRKEKPMRVRQAWVPVGKSEKELYELASRVLSIRDLLPSSETQSTWASIFESWAVIRREEVSMLRDSLTLARLGDRVKDAGTLSGLGALLTEEEEKTALDWLNEVFDALPDGELSAFVKERALVPSQLGALKKQGDLWLDGGIDDNLKDICEKLGEPVRGELLHPGVAECVRQLFEAVKGRTFTEEQCFERAMKRVTLPTEKGKEDAYQEGNARIFAWLVQRRRKEKLDGYPVVCPAGMAKLTSQERMLWPVALWADTVEPFADVFGDERRFADPYCDYLAKEHWDYLEEEGFVLKSVFRKERLGVLDPAQVRDGLGDEAEHKAGAEIDVSDIAFLKGEAGVLLALRKSEQKARRFLQFVLCCVIKFDRSWLDGYQVHCSCGKDHVVMPSWLHDIRTHSWVPVGRGRGERPSAASLSKLLVGELKEVVLTDTEAAQFLLKLGVGVSELVRAGVPEKDQFKLDQLSAKIYGSADPVTLESVEAVLGDEDLQRVVLEKREVKRRVHRNQRIGRAVEELLRAELEEAKIRVRRTGVGSDFEVESDFIEEGREQFLEVSSFLVEVKSTREDRVRMTLVQGREAVKPANRDRYVLCVVDIGNEEPEPPLIRERARFVFGVGELVDKTVAEAAELKEMEGELSGASGGAVGIDIVESSVKLRINEVVWSSGGVCFDAFVEKVKAAGAQSVG